MPSSNSNLGSAAVLELAEEFVERYRLGQRPSLREYIDRHPELAQEIREVFPALVMMEQVSVAWQAPTIDHGPESGGLDRPSG